MMSTREFEKIFRTLYLPLGMYALKYVGDTDVAEDMVQEAFVKIWRQLQEGADIAGLKPYLYMMVRNECVNHLRKQKDTTSDEVLAEMPDVSDDDIDTSERDARLWRAIDALPDRCREIFLMSKRDGMSNEEIATELGISIKTVKNQMQKPSPLSAPPSPPLQAVPSSCPSFNDDLLLFNTKKSLFQSIV